jgi:hypothetical protein
MRNRATLLSMNLTVRKPMTLAEFLAWEERQEQRYEFDGSEPVALGGFLRVLLMSVAGRGDIIIAGIAQR